MTLLDSLCSVIQSVYNLLVNSSKTEFIFKIVYGLVLIIFALGNSVTQNLCLVWLLTVV